jgi:hypothetical protein
MAMDLRATVTKILDSCDGDIDKAGVKILNGERAVALYVLSLGLLTFKGKRRKEHRQLIHDAASGQVVRRVKGRVTGSIKPDPRSQEKYKRVILSIFDTYEFDGMLLGDMKRDDLIASAAALRAQSAGSIKQADWLENIAKRMKPTETVRQRWRGAETEILALRDQIWNKEKVAA